MTYHNSELLFGGLLLLAYLLGSIPWGLILSRIFSSHDVRLKGSRNIGATNVMRETGALPGLLTLAADFLKGAIPVYLAVLSFGAANRSADIFLSGVALAAFLGHLYPLYLKFRNGGKGVATTAGCFAVLSPAAVLVAFGVFIVMLLVVRRVSVGSLAAAATLPAAIWLTTDSVMMLAAACIIALFIFIRHQNNLRRLVAGEEPKFKLRKK
ncbi:MAG: glycerol-3-phosphate 1-O-acyltransferase PlsY [Desulfobacterales bacterium]|jgi:glycerol-3-phosphate acyltransferase PlsY